MRRFCRPFPIAVAFERRLPTKWFEGTEKRTTARLAVIGNGGVFVGQSLNPMKEKLLLDVSNWLLGRDDLLARQNQTWSFPRVEISAVEKQSWIAAMVFGVPLLCVYFGIVVLLARRTR